MNGKYTQIFISVFLSSIKNARINVPMCNSSDSLTLFFLMKKQLSVVTLSEDIGCPIGLQTTV